MNFQSPEADYRVTSTHPEQGKMTVKYGGEERITPCPIPAPSMSITPFPRWPFFSEFGLSRIRSPHPWKSSLSAKAGIRKEEAGGKKVVLHLAKGQNPIACSRAFENIRNYPGRKAVILFLDDYFDAAHSVENTSWYYDTDFEFLNDAGIPQIVAAGARHWDVCVRLLMAGIPESKIAHVEGE